MLANADDAIAPGRPISLRIADEELKVAGVDVAAMGVKAPEHPDDEFVQYSEPRHGVYKTVVIRDGKLVGATLVGDVSKVSFLTQAFDSGLPLPDERVALMFDIGTPDVGVGVAKRPTTHRCVTATGCPKVRWWPVLKTATARSRRPASWRRPRPARVRLVQGVGVPGRGVGGRRRGRRDPSASWYVPGVPYDKPTLMRHIRDLELHSVSSVFAALAPGGRRTPHRR